MQEALRTGVNASHFGVQVATTEDVLEAKSRFEAQGLSTRTEEDTACCYAVQDKVWIEDPDGNSWEVFVVKADAPVMKADASTCCAPVGLSRKPVVEAAPCCSPTPRDAG